MKWKTFKEQKPNYNTPIFVYRPKDGVFSYFKKDDDIRVCKLTSKIERNDGLYYNLQGYDYGSCGTVMFKECDFLKLKWLEIPKP